MLKGQENAKKYLEWSSIEWNSTVCTHCSTNWQDSRWKKGTGNRVVKWHMSDLSV